ncbi:MAG: phosphomannomutase [Verrucomicrobiae bacterium]|nr:phosphomannomutase [Verrucomicrobiae bacterium]
MTLSLREWMALSGVKFGTSGARGRVTDMTDRVCEAYTSGFLGYLRRIGDWPDAGGFVAVAGDLRPSTGRIMAAVRRAIRAAGGRPIACGRVPSPAVALLGLERRIPAIMVTGSHIPDDRNGIKFNKSSGEILKDDEAGMMEQAVAWEETAYDGEGAWRGGAEPEPELDEAAGEGYVRRYLEGFPGRPLRGLRLGIYQHSAVGRDLLMRILSGLGAETVPLGRSDRFLPVDTEAIREEDVALARDWAEKERFDAIVSTDGDSDRPLVSDESGRWLRGDVAGILCARFLGAEAVVTPVSSNTAVERTGWFAEVRRTRIGSPYVVAAMNALRAEGRNRVVGYEANGGFLVGADFELPEGRLGALPTRDAVIVMLGVLMQARREGRSVSEAVAALPGRWTASDRLTEFPVERSRAIMERLGGSDAEGRTAAVERVLGGVVGDRVADVDLTDGVRATFRRGEVVHLRPSGNAPEFRCYTEADTEARAVSLCAAVLGQLRDAEEGG